MNWYLLQAKPNAHQAALQNLKNQGFEVFLPLIMKTSKRRKAFVDHTTPLFPSYLFMGTTREQVPWKSVNATRGILKAVTLDGKYRNVDSEIVERLKSRCDANGVIQKMDNVITGDRVKIEKGPFAEFVCHVDQIIDNQRVWVLIEILQQKTRFNCLLRDLSKVT